MSLPPIQDLVYRPSGSPASKVSDGGEKGHSHGSWNPWHTSQVPGKDILSMRAGAVDTSGMLVRSMRTWEVKMPPIKKHMVGGHLIPTVRGAVQFLAQRSRRVSIEIHGPPLTHTDTSVSLSPMKQTMMQRLLLGETPGSDLEKEVLYDGDAVYFKILKETKGSRSHGNGRDDTSAGSSAHDSLNVSALGLDGADDIDEDKARYTWTERGSYRLEDVVVLKSYGRSCEVKFGTNNEVIVRDIKFDSEKDRLSFQRVMDKFSALERERAESQYEAYKSSKQGSDSKSKKEYKDSSAIRTMALPGLEEGTEPINLLVEIVSAMDIPVADLFSSDAYVIVQMGGKEVHRTGVISKNLDPIWTLNSRCLFLLTTTPEDFFSSTGGMSFTMKDYDAVGANEVLGRVRVKLDDLLKGTGERIGYDIIPDIVGPDGAQEKKHGKLFLRFKEATSEDIEFMTVYHDNHKKVGVYLEETFLPPRPPNTKLLKRQTKRDLHKNLVRRVRPYPDPIREDETKWMTDQQIGEEAVKHSTNWTEAGSGGLGKLYVEVIGCDKLPNLDSTSLNLRDKTDAFACLIFEDAVVNTDVIGDSLSPRWMPWCRRAFVFNIAHPSSDLQLGIFDYDPELSPIQLVSRAAADLHDPVGRIHINISNFFANTVYTLKYNIFYGDLAKDRMKTRGTITLRMRIDWADRKKTVIASVIPPAPSYVSVARTVDFQFAHYTAAGMHDENKFDMTAFTRYIEELQSYEKVLDYLREAVLTVWLWRGHCDVNICGKRVSLPLHSITAFVWGLLVTWDFNMFPSFLAFSVGWVFLACNEQTRKNPSPWHRRRAYFPLLWTLISGQGRKPETIVANQNLAAIDIFNKAAEERKVRLEKEREQEAKEDKEIREELGEELEDSAAQDVDITSKREGVLEKIFVNPLKGPLHPIQLQLKQIVVALRIATSVVIWEETFYAFWVVTISFAVSAATILIPWGFMLRWVLRIVAFVCLGPWMLIVDRLYFRDKPNMTDEEKKAVAKKRLRSRYDEVVEAATSYHVRRERAVKLKAMKKYMFGKFLMRVPLFREAMYQDVPLPESFTVPYVASDAEPVVVNDRKYGQNLFGDMIPQRDIQAAEAAKAETCALRSLPPTSILRFWKRKGHEPSERVPLLSRFGERVPLLSRFGGNDLKEYKAVDGEVKVEL